MPKLRHVPMLLALLFVLVACGPVSPRDVEPQVVTYDTESIVATVVARAEHVLVQAPAVATPAPSVAAEPSLDAIVAAVLAELGPALTPEPIPTTAAEQVVPIAVEQEPAAATANLGLLAAADLQNALVEVYQRANPAVVYILSERSSGSGFVYDAEGHIITNNHVISTGRTFEVVFADGERRPGAVVGADADSDLAVLRVEDLPASVTALPLAAAGDLLVGQFVVAIGNPFGEQGSMSLGIVSGLDRSLRSQRGQTTTTAYSLPQVIQTDAPINPGNSGGPLLNLAGEVVGVNSAIATTTGANTGVGFSIPVAALHQIVPSLIETGRYEYPYMGAMFDDEISLAEQAAYGLPHNRGVYVLGLTAGSPAAQAGLRAANSNTGRGGDLIVALDGQPITSFSDLNSYLVFNTSVGQTITVTVLRDGATLDLELILGARP